MKGLNLSAFGENNVCRHLVDGCFTLAYLVQHFISILVQMLNFISGKVFDKLLKA